MTKPTGDELLQQVRQAIETYVTLPSAEHTTAVTLWIAATHAVPAWNTATRLVVGAPEKRCGKTRLLAIIEALCHKPITAQNASTAAIYRSIDMSGGDPPTILIDEADTTLRSEEGNDLKGLLNVGHQRGRPALRWNQHTQTVETLDTFAMVALASIGRLPDTIEDRAVIIPMKRRAGGEHVKPYRPGRDAAPLRQLGQQLHTWVRSHQKQLQDTTPPAGIADPWTPLAAIAELAQGEWPHHTKTAAAALATATKELH